MKHISVTAQARPDDMTKSAVKTLRKEGRVLASVYGKGELSTSVILSASDIMRILSAETGENTLIDLAISDKPGRRLARLTAIEMEPLTSRFRHVGLNLISATEMQKATVPVEFVGEPEDVRNNLAFLDTINSTVDISALPENFVGGIVLDISEMKVGDILTVAALQIPEKIEITTDPETVLIVAREPRVEVSEEVVQADAESPEVTGVTNDSSSPEEALQNV